jgi:uncharacterized protein
MKKNIIAIIAIVGTLNSAVAQQIPVTLSSLNYSQNFNFLSDTAVAISVGIPASSGWAIFETGGGAQDDDKYKSDNGSSTSGNTYAYRTPGSADKALGSLASGTLRSTFGGVFVNNTGVQIDTVYISFRSEQWRAGGDTTNIPDTLNFSYSTSAVVIDSTLPNWTAAPQLNARSFITSPSGATDGNASAYSATISYKIPVIISPAGTFAIRWSDVNSGGSDDGIAIDDLFITFIQQGGNPASKPLLISTTPSDGGNNVMVTTTALTLTFDQQVSLGTGNFTVKNTSFGGLDQIIPAASAQVSGAIVTLPINNLRCSSDIAVQFDSTAVKANGLNSVGIYNNTDWNFSTEICVGIQDQAQNINTYLNVIGNTLQVLANTAVADNILTITNLNGSIMAQQKVTSYNGQVKAQINNLNIPSGMYLFTISNAQQKTTLKFILD